ncbi:RNA polymerase sigma factor [Auraticoccus monumenti]|uniref:RNA polymerase sigma factor, sigma-70 family n=1 Tax=Auraticoccus monumenti TaxID=675864 RepID=A0A1G6SAA5_9ACTN|nr:DUF6596 domain-containing protein [Auraticoccus monumenti]SDD13870.1 RNA polymerase sigma factor, sigma-70 family [Auraticoccus monumenti]
MSAAFEDVWRRESPRVLGALLRRHGDLADCEDAVQEAAVAAVRQWEQDGLPDDPGAWLVRVASRRLVDRVRADRARAAREEREARQVPVRVHHDPLPSSPGGSDDSLELLLLCCHPALSRSSQVALTLRSVCGLGVDQIAAAYLVPAPTMAQRITRARSTLRSAGARFERPGVAELPGRVAAVLDVCHLVFTEGHTRSDGPELLDVALAEEAIRLTRALVGWLPDHDEAAGLLALLLLTHARAPARTDAVGDLVVMAEQDRSRWDAALVAEGVGILERVLPRGPVGRYQLQAAIAAVHAEAAGWEDTDWPQVVALYELLDRVAPGPAVTLNRAVAVSMVSGPGPALELVGPLLVDRSMARHHRTHAVHAHLLERAGEPVAAAEAYRRASRLATSGPEQRYLNARLARLTSAG